MEYSFFPCLILSSLVCLTSSNTLRVPATLRYLIEIFYRTTEVTIFLTKLRNKQAKCNQKSNRIEVPRQCITMYWMSQERLLYQGLRGLQLLDPSARRAQIRFGPNRKKFYKKFCTFEELELCDEALKCIRTFSHYFFHLHTSKDAVYNKVTYLMFGSKLIILYKSIARFANAVQQSRP